MAMVVNVMAKRRDKRSRQVWMKETNASEPPMKHRNSYGDIQTRVSHLLWDKGVEGYLLTVHAVSGVKGA
jgi:hypothetical protein